jgi:hypothetical protein
MAITHAWSSTVGAINGNGVTMVIPPSSVQTGDVVILFGGKPGRASTSIGALGGLNYTQIFSTGANAKGPNFGAWFKIMGATPDSSIVALGSANASDGTAYGAYIFRGVSSVMFDVAHQSVIGNSTNPDPPSVITATNNAVVVAVAGSQVNDAAVYSILGYSDFRTATANDSLDITVLGNWASIAAAGSTDPGVFNAVATASWVSGTIVLKPATTPTVTTSVITEITETTATGGGNVTADGGSPILERGVVWNTSTNPTTANSKANTAGTTGFFQSSIASLSSGTHYFVRAFAINNMGSVYGSNEEFDSQSVASFSNTIFTGNPHKFNFYKY